MKRSFKLAFDCNWIGDEGQLPPDATGFTLLEAIQARLQRTGYVYGTIWLNCNTILGYIVINLMLCQSMSLKAGGVCCI